MNSFFNKQRTKKLLAGILAAVIFILPLAGCQDKALEGLFSSPAESSSAAPVQSQASSVQSSKAPSSQASAISSAASIPKAEAKTSSVAAVKPEQKVQPKKTVASKAPTGNQSIKKIVADQSAQSGTRLAVTQGTVAAAGYSHIDQRSGYNYLTDSVSRNLYSAMLQSAYKVTLQPASNGYYPTSRIVVNNSHLTEAQIRIVLMAFLNDNPQVFWLANAYSYGYNDTQTTIQLYSVVSQSQCNTMIQQMNAKVSALVKAMPSGLSELDREVYLFDYLVKTCTYDTAAAADSTQWKAFTSYGALVEGHVVCEGYSRAMQLLSSYAGLQCMLLTGQSDGVNHMWNLMKIGGNWYHLDITWCDNNPTIYNLFNITDAVITQTHSIFPSASTLSAAQIEGSNGSAAAGCNLSIPVCTATAANYFQAKGIHISDLNGTNDSAAVSAITAAAKAKKESVSFYVEGSADFDQILNGMLKSSPYKLVTYLNDVNKQPGMTNQIAINSLKYIADPSDRGMTIFLSYQ